MEIRIEGLNKKYGKQCALKDISLHIPVGMYGLLGENGAGKTTLMRILATLLEPSTGTIEINGIDIKRKKEIRKIIGYLPQEFSIYPNMTVYQALDYLGILAELPKNIRKHRINELLKQVNLEQEKNKRGKDHDKAGRIRVQKTMSGDYSLLSRKTEEEKKNFNQNRSMSKK